MDKILDINDRWLLLKKILLNVIDKYCPKVKVKHKSKRLPWLDASTFKLRHYRDKVYHKAIASKNKDDWEYYKKIRNDYNRLIKLKMKEYFLIKMPPILNLQKNIGVFTRNLLRPNNLLQKIQLIVISLNITM